MTQCANKPAEQLSDASIIAIRESLIARFRHRVVNRDDLESMADEAIAHAISKYDPTRVTKSHMGAYVAMFSDFKLRNLLQPEYRWADVRKAVAQAPEVAGRSYGPGSFLSGELYDLSKPDHGQGNVAMDGIIEEFGQRDQWIIRMRLKGHTMKKIGQVLGVTHQRIQQIFARLRKATQALMPVEVKQWKEDQYCGRLRRSNNKLRKRGNSRKRVV